MTADPPVASPQVHDDMSTVVVAQVETTPWPSLSFTPLTTPLTGAAVRAPYAAAVSGSTVRGQAYFHVHQLARRRRHRGPRHLRYDAVRQASDRHTLRWAGVYLILVCMYMPSASGGRAPWERSS